MSEQRFTVERAAPGWELTTDEWTLRSDDLVFLLDRLYVGDDSDWTCPGCGAVNGGAYRLVCKSCNDSDNRHPWCEQLMLLWRVVGREVDEEGPELVPPRDWLVNAGPGTPHRAPPHHTEGDPGYRAPTPDDDG